LSTRFRLAVVGLGIQGPKRIKAAGVDFVTSVDPVMEEAEYRKLKDVPLNSFDAAAICTPDAAKIELLTYLLSNGKHVIVEKPLCGDESSDLTMLKTLADHNNAVCYTAYNHRFEPHFVRMKQVIDSGDLGEIYRLRLFYGNGTARDVRNSGWRDTGAGVLPDLGSHLLDTVGFWLGEKRDDYSVTAANRYENKSFDHVIVASDGKPGIELEMTLLSWRNHFTADVFGSAGSAHISSLCKWGSSTFTHRTRVLPSGRPGEQVEIAEQGDPTWAAEYDFFKNLCVSGGEGNISNDMWLNGQLQNLTRQALQEFRS
jgi:scyllo-inositol 2-dehydrogenase (NADP+)